MSKPDGNLFIVTAPSGAGKTSLLNALAERVPEASLSVSHTTRPPRAGEIDGEHYYFVDKAEFRRMIDAGAFLEHAEVFGNYYGTSVAEVDSLRARDKDVILEIDWQGARQIMARAPEAISIFILPPSMEALEKRLHKRGLDASDVIERRLKEAQVEMSHFGEFDYLVVNDHFQTALDDLVGVLRSARLRRGQQERRYRDLIKNLLES